MRILIIEDEKKAAQYLEKGLTENGYIVTVAYDGRQGLFHIQEETFDLIILDVMLPYLDGWNLIEKIRKQSATTRVLFLTAKDDVNDRVKGLELGADDYLTKPFAFSELLARIKTLLRRKGDVQNTELTIADLRIDFVQHKVWRGEIAIDLTAKEFQLLSFFIQRQDEVMSRTLIAERVWDIHFDNESNAVDVAIRRLRQKIDEAFSPKLIHTVRGVGYVFKIS